MKIRLLMISVFLVCAFAAPASAQDYNPYLDQVAALNQIRPLQNPKYDHAEDVLSRRLLDRKSKVIGQIEDIVISEDGALRFLDVDLDRLRLGRISLNYSKMNMQTGVDSYSVAIEGAQVESRYPGLLAEMETASGAADELFSVRKMIGIPVKTQSGRTIGRVDEVLFGGDGSRVEALYVGMSAGVLRGEHVAIPFGGKSMTLQDAGTRKAVIVAPMMEEAMLSYVRNNK